MDTKSKLELFVPDQLYTTVEVAQVLRVAREQVRIWVASKEIPAVKIGNKWRVLGSDANAYLVKNYTGTDTQDAPRKKPVCRLV